MKSTERLGRSVGGKYPPCDFRARVVTIASSPTPERSPSPFSLALRRARISNVTRPFKSMATLSTGHFSTASKRSRSQQSSPAPLESPPAPKATKTEETEKEISIPAFLRQPKAGELTPCGPNVRRRDRAYAANVLRSTASDVNAKFRELNWQEKLRIVQGRSDPESKWMQEVSPHVLQRNRYLGVQPWDKSRIHLRVAEGDSDYINASPITLQDPRTGVETTYIATQVLNIFVLSFPIFFSDLMNIQRDPKRIF